MTEPDPAEKQLAIEFVDRGRYAMAQISDWDQEQINLAVRALAWSVYSEDAATELANLAVETTGLGNVADKVKKNQRKTLGTLRDLLRLPSVGVIPDQSEAGIVKLAKPVGVVASLTPSTNPGATPINNAMMAINGANAIVFAPSPAGWATTNRVVELAHAALEAVGAPKDLVQVLPNPVSRSMTQALMEASDLIVATGAQENVRAAYRTGVPAIGVGAGNVPVIIDESANLADAAQKICQSKTFDNATSCSAENSLVILDSVYERALEELVGVGARLVDSDDLPRVRDQLFPNGSLNRDVIAKDFDVLCEKLSVDFREGRFLLVELPDADPSEPLCSEKLALVTSVFRASDIDHALHLVEKILEVQGKGHSAGIHTKSAESVRKAGERLDVARVLVNQAHAVGNGGSFDNSLPFSLSMGCGTWGKNSISENLSGKHFLNTTRIVRTIDADQPTEDELFGPLWAATGH